MRVLPLVGLCLLAACLRVGPAPPRGLLPIEQQAWWERLRQLCGGSYPGRLLEEGSADERYHGPLAARVARCPADTVEIAFDVGAERTRTWQVIRLPGALRLRHLHSDARGTPDSPTGYGGETVTPGSARRQDFPADTATARTLPPAARNVWTLEIDPGQQLVYTLGRVGSARHFRVAFSIPSR